MNSVFIATPLAVIRAFIDILTNGTLISAFLSSALEMFGGLLIAAVFGIGAGILMGRVRLVERCLDPFVNFFNATPTIALLPLMVIWFGLGVRARIAFIVIICVWTLLINTLTGVKNVSRHHADVGRAFGLSGRELTTRIFIPAAMPYILTGVRVALAQAAVGMILSGQEVGESGLGGLTENYGSFFQTDYLIAAILSTTALAMLSFWLLRRFQAMFYPWIAALAAARR